MTDAAAVGPQGDFRFLLPAIPKVVAVVGTGFDRHRLDGAGVRIVAAGDPAVDTVVAADADAAEAAAQGAPQVVLFGWGRTRPKLPGYEVTPWVALGSDDHPDGFATRRHRVAAQYAVGVWRRPSSNVKAGLLRLATRTGLPLPGREVITVGVRPGAATGRANLLGAAGLPAHVSGGWFLATPGVEPTSRVAAFVFDERGDRPWAVLKVLRIPDVDTPFEEDARGLGLVRPLGPDVARHVPQLLARGRWDGHHASIETAAAGQPLSTILRDDTMPVASRASAVDAVAAWIVEVGCASAAPVGADAPSRRHLADDLAATWPEVGPALLAAVAGAPGVVTHGDLGTWNVVADPDADTFTVLDWEAADPHGLPLGDLAYFLGDALALLGGARTVEERTTAMVELFAGRAARSADLLGWLRRGADAVGLEPDDAGRLVTLAWLHHAVLPPARVAAGGERRWPAELVAERWLADPDLGPGWQLPR